MCSPDGARRGALTDRSAKAPARRAQRARAATTRGCGGQADPLSRGHKVMRRAGSARTAAGPTAPCSMRLPQERRSSAVGALVTGSLLPAASTPSFLKLAVRSSSVGERSPFSWISLFSCLLYQLQHFTLTLHPAQSIRLWMRCSKEQTFGVAEYWYVSARQVCSEIE